MIFKRLYPIAVACVVVFLLYEISSAIYISQTTGILQLNSSKPQAYLTVYQSGKQAVNVGFGTTKVHLRPGSYQVTATSGLNQITKNVEVVKKGFVKISLNPSSSSNIPKSYLDTEELITKLLPFTGPGFEYQISYKYSFINSVAEPVIVITAPSSEAQQAAVSWLNSQGYNPANMNISYVTAQP